MKACHCHRLLAMLDQPRQVMNAFTIKLKTFHDSGGPACLSVGQQAVQLHCAILWTCRRPKKLGTTPFSATGCHPCQRWQMHQAKWMWLKQTTWQIFISPKGTHIQLHGTTGMTSWKPQITPGAIDLHPHKGSSKRALSHNSICQPSAHHEMISAAKCHWQET